MDGESDAYGEVAAVLRELDRQGFMTERLRDGPEYLVRSREPGHFRHRVVLRIPPDLLHAYLMQEGPAGYAEALSMVKLHAEEYLGTDHGDGVNATTALGFRRAASGRVEFFWDVDRSPLAEPAGELLEWRSDWPPGHQRPPRDLRLDGYGGAPDEPPGPPNGH